MRSGQGVGPPLPHVGDGRGATHSLLHGRPDMSGRIAALVTIVLLVGAVLFRCYWWSEGHGASLTRLASVHPGMSGDQVRRILGRPGTISSQTWFYTRWTWCQVKVYFDDK